MCAKLIYGNMAKTTVSFFAASRLRLPLPGVGVAVPIVDVCGGEGVVVADQVRVVLLNTIIYT